ncbi:MAG TPA: hypothetical protein VMZ66_00315 [Aeromicrobium sp.]|nr:hypothetical protein [Aeromicrobium sp.]
MTLVTVECKPALFRDGLDAMNLWLATGRAWPTIVVDPCSSYRFRDLRPRDGQSQVFPAPRDWQAPIGPIVSQRSPVLLPFSAA